MAMTKKPPKKSDGGVTQGKLSSFQEAPPAEPASKTSQGGYGHRAPRTGSTAPQGARRSPAGGARRGG
jgi:hypothetical protein